MLFEVVIPWKNKRGMIDKAVMKVCVRTGSALCVFGKGYF